MRVRGLRERRRVQSRAIRTTRKVKVLALDIAALRRDYALATLDVVDVDPDPVRQFERWLGEAIAARAAEPTAMSLATVGEGGQPSSQPLRSTMRDEG